MNCRMTSVTADFLEDDLSTTWRNLLGNWNFRVKLRSVWRWRTSICSERRVSGAVAWCWRVPPRRGFAPQYCRTWPRTRSGLLRPDFHHLLLALCTSIAWASETKSRQKSSAICTMWWPLPARIILGRSSLLTSLAPTSGARHVTSSRFSTIPITGTMIIAQNLIRRDVRTEIWLLSLERFGSASKELNNYHVICPGIIWQSMII